MLTKNLIMEAALRPPIANPHKGSFVVRDAEVTHLFTDLDGGNFIVSRFGEKTELETNVVQISEEDYKKMDAEPLPAGK